ncbi:MAG: ABC transporter ATP-binding protein [Proteobacteria bacterium]|nr:ABC transporter ATP-binding protein [Pseudomonadota bacterium]
MSLLRIEDLHVAFKSQTSESVALNHVSIDIPEGKTIGLVGESGSGKSVTALTIMRLLPTPPANIHSGKIIFEGRDLLTLSDAELRKIRGNKISMIFQEPMTSLNPVFTVGFQISEVLQLHQGLTRKQAWDRSIELLDQVGIPKPQQKVYAYPHEMSGGQKQRVMIAMAIACNPKLLIADEPTTALDVTIQKQVLELLAKLKEQYKMSMLFITHDLGVIADIADHVVVMYRGNIVEQNSCEALFKAPQHPYTKGLLACRPSLDNHPHRLVTVSDFMTEDGKEKAQAPKVDLIEKETRVVSEANPVILDVRNLQKHFPIRGGLFGGVKDWVKAVDDVSLQVRKGRTLGLVGESGCGKTTLGRCLLRLIEPTGGEILYKGSNLAQLSAEEMRKMRRKLQIIFQDPYASLNPRMTVGDAILEPMAIHEIGANTKERKQMAEELMNKVGLQPNHLIRYPHEFSGGQRQRICIARALAVKPEFIICDESVSALDVSIQAQILNLLLDLQEEFGLTYVFISHDLAVVKFIADEVAVMYGGKIVEYDSAVNIYKKPQDSYTKKLLEAIPRGIPQSL